jgi:ABC-type transport system substrate-binding protein
MTSKDRNKRLNRREFLRLAGLSGLAAGLAACAPETPEPEVIRETVEVTKVVEQQVTQVVEQEKLVTPTPVLFKREGSLVFGMNGDTKTLDPHVSELWVWQNIRFQIFDRLVILDADVNIQPWLATEYKWVDNTTLELALRDDVVFHNSEQFSAEDVKFTMDRIQNPDLPSELRVQLEGLEETEVLDDTHVRMHLKEPDATFPFTLANIDIISKSVPVDDIPTTPIGTGAFKFVEWRPNEYLKLERNDDYYEPGLPYLDELIYKPMPDSESRIASLIAGDIDVNFEVAAKDVARLATTPGIDVTISPTGGIWMMYLNLRLPPFSDKKVRQALLYGFDRKGYNRDFLSGLSTVTNTTLPPNSWAYNPEVDEMYTYDPDKALELLAEAGYPEGKGLEIEIIYPVGLEEYKTASEYFQATMAEIGVEVEVTGMELAAWSNKIIKEKTYQIALDGRGSGQGVPALAFNDFTFFKPDEENFDGFTEDTIPGYLDLIKQGKAETDQEKRKEIYFELQRLWAEELPGWILTRNPDILVMREWVQGYEAAVPRPPQIKIAWLDK